MHLGQGGPLSRAVQGVVLAACGVAVGVLGLESGYHAHRHGSGTTAEVHAHVHTGEHAHPHVHADADPAGRGEAGDERTPQERSGATFTLQAPPAPGLAAPDLRLPEPAARDAGPAVLLSELRAPTEDLFASASPRGPPR